MTSLVVRRYAGGRRRSDVPVAVAASPWHLVSAALGTVVALLLPAAVAVAHVLRGVGVVSLTGGSPRPDTSAPLAAGALLGILTAWWGPGGASLRRGARSLVRGTVRGGRPARSSSRRWSWPPQGWASGPGCGPACPPGGRGHRRSCRSPPCATADPSATFRAPARRLRWAPWTCRDRELEDDDPEDRAGRTTARRARTELADTFGRARPDGVAREAAHRADATGRLVAAHAVPRAQPAGADRLGRPRPAPPSTWPCAWASCSCAAAPVPATSSRA